MQKYNFVFLSFDFRMKSEQCMLLSGTDPSGLQCTESWKQGKLCHGYGGDKTPPFQFQSWQPCNGTDKLPTIPLPAIATWQKASFVSPEQ